MSTESKPHLTRNPISMLGVWLATVCALLFLSAFVGDLFGLHTNPYMGIVFFLVLPSFFICGLLIIPVGMMLERRRLHRLGPGAARVWPHIDLNVPRHRRIAFIVGAATVFNVVVVALAGYRGIEYMDSVPFCGQLCHEVMQPEFAAYQEGPHSRVTCVQCHIGPGAPWFVQSKLSGTRQVFAVALNTFGRPIPAPVVNLRPARDTCEQCHWPERFAGDVVRVIREYASDETNTETATTMQVHVGGGGMGPAGAVGIHWHINPANRIDYISTDEKRQVIPYVRMVDQSGKVSEFVVEGTPAGELARGEHRTMDCMDCHNRPTHPFAATAERAVDHAIGFGEISRTLPFVRREAVSAVKSEFSSQDAAADAVAERLTAFYRKNYPQLLVDRKGELEQTIKAVQRIYRRSVFPSMRVTWGSYPNNLGHTDFQGCFRCHDDNHKTQDGRVIKQDCELCHSIG